MFAFLNAHGSELITKTWEQLYISAIALGLGVIVAVPLGILLTRFPKTAKVVIGIASMLQTVPSLALLALMIPLFGIGKCLPSSHCSFTRCYRFCGIRISVWKMSIRC
jgi:osmoprotectant transport system permease protein